MRKSAVALVIAAQTMTLAGGIAVAANHTHTPALKRTAEVKVFYKIGPGITCSGDSCGLSGPHPVSFQLPPGTSYTATITLSFDYRTSDRGSFVIGPSLKPRTTALQPAERPLARSVQLDTRSASFTVTGLRGGTIYNLSVGATTRHRPLRGRVVMTTRRLLVDLIARPTGR
ncbi:MAG: hypothetical protein JO246_15205 [Frankiaceae bacterium]|nr:hypothetical protein [Frankiaceae bacterium]